MLIKYIFLNCLNDNILKLEEILNKKKIVRSFRLLFISIESFMEID